MVTPLGLPIATCDGGRGSWLTLLVVTLVVAGIYVGGCYLTLRGVDPSRGGSISAFFGAAAAFGVIALLAIPRVAPFLSNGELHRDEVMIRIGVCLLMPMGAGTLVGLRGGGGESIRWGAAGVLGSLAVPLALAIFLAVTFAFFGFPCLGWG